MWFELLHVAHTPKTDLVEALVSDEVYTDATVQWSSFTRADRIWAGQQLDALLAHWVTLDPSLSTRATHWTLEPIGDDNPPRHFGLTLLHNETPLHAPLLLRDLPPEHRAAVDTILSDLLSAFHALLLIA